MPIFSLISRGRGHILLFIILLLALGCATTQDDAGPVNSASCIIDSDCILPMDYAIQSNCPFQALCIKGRCAVVCPLYYHDPVGAVSRSYAYPCSSDDDCNCSWRAERTLSCLCHDKSCVSVEEYLLNSTPDPIS